MTPTVASGSKNHAHHKRATFSKPVITGPSREYISLLRDAPALVARMRKLGLVRERGLHFKEDSK